MLDKTFDVAMISMQGPLSRSIMEKIVTKGKLPDPARNCLSLVEINGAETALARTGYTGEPLGFELFLENKHAVAMWTLLMEKWARPIGLGARDTLRLEACLPLYGHELGIDHDGKEIPLFASKLSKFAVSFSPLKGDFIGKKALSLQHQALKNIMNQNFKDISPPAEDGRSPGRHRKGHCKGRLSRVFKRPAGGPYHLGHHDPLPGTRGQRPQFRL